jgi:hypothetical protein
MKKLFFVAVLSISFCGISKANTIVDDSDRISCSIVAMNQTNAYEAG